MARLFTCSAAALALLAGSLVSEASMAETPPQTDVLVAPQASRTTRLVLLGTAGGPIPRVMRSQPANLLQVGDRIYLIDAGDGVARQLAAAGVQPKAVNVAFITHLHLDHMAGIAPLLAFRWVSRPTEPVALYGPAGLRRVTDGAVSYLSVTTALFEAQLPPGPSLAKSFEVKEIRATGPAQIYADDLVKVTAVENSHYDTMDKAHLPEASKSYAYRFDTPDRSIVFTGDTGPSAAIEQLARGADILVSEVIDLKSTLRFMRDQYRVPEDHLQAEVAHMEREHLVPEELGRMATRAGVKMVVLTHAVLGLDSEHDMRIYADGVRKTFAGPVVMGKDLEEF